MKLVNIGAKDFWSFKDLSYTFEDKPIQVNGQNLTDDDQDSNGSGKSALLAIIQLLWLNVQYVYMETENKAMNKETLVNFDAKQAIIWGEINCPIRKETLKVERIIKKVGSASQLSVNGVIKFAFEDKMVSEIDTFIIDWIGISKEDLLNFYFVNKEKHKSLYTSNNNTKLEVYNRFSNANLIDGIDEFVKEDVKVIEDKVKVVQSAIDSIHGEIASTERRIIAERERDIKQEITDRVDGYKKQIDTYKNDNVVALDSKKLIAKEIKELELSIKDWDVSLTETQNKLSNFDLKPLNDQLHQITEKRSKIRSTVTEKNKQKESFNKDIDEATEMLNEIERNINGSVKCPKCAHEFVVGKVDVDISEEKETKVLLEEGVTQAQASINAIKQSIADFSSKELKPLDEKETEINTKIQDFNRKIRSIKEEVSEIETEIENINNSIVSKNRRLNSIDLAIEETTSLIGNYEQKIIEAESEDPNDNVRLKELKVELKDLHKSLKTKELELSLVNDNLFDTTQWIHNFKKFKGFLAGKSLKVIQGHLNHYLENMGSDIRIKMEGFKQNSKGDTVENITPYVIRDGQIRLFGSFSGGERGRMIYSELLTFMHIINSTNKWGGLWFNFSDELAEGCDAMGLQQILKSMHELKFPILIATHVVDRSVNDNKLVVVKENGVSTILNN